MSYLLSIVVPTKDRYKYLKYLINSIDNVNFSEIEVVIQDNTFDNSEIINFLSGRLIRNLKYFHFPDQVPISLNVDLAISNSSGEYVCFIGDDDGVLPNIIDCVKWMKINNIDALRPAITIYNWPDFYDSNHNELGGSLFYDNFSFDIEKIDVLKSLKKLANRGFTHIYTIPKVYQGIVKRQCLDDIYAIGGTFTPGPSPDMATAVALSLTVKKFVAINLPVILVGQSQFVGGGERKLNGGVKDINEVPFLPRNAKENWSHRIPKVWCTQTVWPESALKAIQYMNKGNFIAINYEFILAKFIYLHPSEYRMAFDLSKNKLWLSAYLIYFYTSGSYYSLRAGIKRFISKNKISEGRDNAVQGIESIDEACEFLLNKFPKHCKGEVFQSLKL